MISLPIIKSRMSSDLFLLFFVVYHLIFFHSTNWQTCRWKPPPPPSTHDGKEDPHIGWRTEFRSMEVQLTDFENAAFTVFVALITRVVLAFDLAFYIPLSKVSRSVYGVTINFIQ